MAFTIKNHLIGTLFGFGLFITLMTVFLTDIGGNYDTSGLDQTSIDKYNYYNNISTLVDNVQPDIDKVAVDKNWFDYLAGLFNQLTQPFRTTYRSYKLMFTIGGDIQEDFKLQPIITNTLVALLTIIVIIGIVMMKFYQGRNPND